MKLDRKVVWPVAVLLLGLVGTISLITARPRVATRAAGRPIPLVEVVAVERSPERVVVTAQGTVSPRSESELVAEVSGRIVWVSPSLANGGFVEPDEVLVRIDPGDYEVAVERAEAALERADSERATAEAELARVEKMARNGVASPSKLDDARNAARVARASRRDAAAALRQSRRDLERTRITSPFTGRVRTKHIGRGQFVSRGTPVARVYAVDYAEVRLPLTNEDAAFLDLPIDYRGVDDRAAAADRDAADTADTADVGEAADAGDEPAAEGPRVRLRSTFAGSTHTWTGRIVRTEGEIDPRTRMIHAVARVEDPYGRSNEDASRPPLAVGMFVEAEIEGRVLEDAIAIPRSALRGRDRVVVVDEDDQLRNRRIGVLRRDRDKVLVSSGLEAGDRVCSTPMPLAVDGTVVRVAPVPDAAPVDAVAATGEPAVRSEP
ncbi:MAG: efflux RND transporter periplasmic adaptor subunit [Myxococcota bacterium]